LDQTILPPDAATFDPNAVAFGHFRFTFTANSSATTLRFTDIGTDNSIADTLVDSVTFVPEVFARPVGATPTPTPTPTATPSATPTPTPTTLPLNNGDFETGPFNTV